MSRTPRTTLGRPSSGSRVTIPSGFGKSLLTASGNRVSPESLVGPYEILDELGKGGMGIVYKARHIHLNRIVALKMILGGVNVSEAHLDRFRIEAESVAKLNHSNIVQVYDIGEHNGAPYIALELVEGGNLTKKCEAKPQTAKFAAQTVETLARAVHVAHAAGVVHRDLKPQNVLMTLDGQPKVTDFGLAKDIAGSSGQTHAGSILGTPSYMAPEQAAGRVTDIGPPTDVYALGCILYEMLVGHPPFRGESPIATIRLVLDGEAVPPRAFQPNTPRDLDTICLKALQKPIHRRYPTAAEFAEDLRRYLDGETIKARPTGLPERVWKWVKRNPARATAFVIFHIFAAILLGLGIWSYIAITKKAEEAELAHKSAKRNLDESTRRMIRLNVANGTRLLDSFDYLGAPLWFAEALRLESQELGQEPGFDERERMHRIRLRAVFDHCPRTSHIWLHEVAMTDAAYDARGRFAVTASEDGIARVWSTQDGNPVGPPLEHGAPIRAVAITGDGSLVATAGADGYIRTWQPKDGKLLQVFNNGAAVTKALITPDNRFLVTGGAAGRVRKWELSTLNEKSLYDFTDRVTDVQFSADGSMVAACSRDGTARVFDLKNGHPVTPPIKRPVAMTAVALAPDGKRVVTSSRDGTVGVWDTTTGQAVFPPLKHTAAVNDVAVTADGKRIVTACDDATAKVWDMTTGQAVGRPVMHDGPVIMVTTSPDGRWAATAAEDNTIRVWDILSGDLITPPIRNNALAAAVRFSPNGYEVMVADQTRVTRIWNLISSGDLSGTTTVQKAAGGPTGPGRDDMQTVTSKDGQFGVTFGGGQSVRVRRSSDHEPRTPPLRSGAAITAAEFTPDGTTLVTGDLDGGVMAWSTTDGKALWDAPAKHVSKVLRVVFNPMGTAIITTSDDNTVRIWNVSDGLPVVPPVRIGGGVNAVAFGPDGKLFYTELASGKGRVWDANTGEPITPPFRARKDWLGSLIVAKWNVEEMLAGGRMLSGQRLSAGGDVIPTDAVSLRNDWAMLKDKYAIVAQTPPAAISGWRERQVATCLDADQWYAAGWHLDQLILSSPDVAEFQRKRAVVSANLGDWKRAADGAKQAILLQPANAESWYQRGVALGQLGDWRDAAAHVNKAMQLKADAKPATGLLAKVRLEAGDTEGYHKACHELLGQNRDATDPALARDIAWTCSLSPGDAADLVAVVKFANLAIKSTPTDPTTVMVQALATVRDGRVEEAIPALESLCAAKDCPPTAWAVYALALRRVGKPEESKGWQTRATQWLAEQTSGPGVPPTWDTRAELEILLRELGT
ncbi:protein kinase domain-containing protein [Limnoglobus roseus]|uniref:protein kinase domain-containing protein n=1 Tax=Limnoglobus roseus TaxID=2598579 RepID=UPI00143D4F13|nr:protein kinase [Limnoglobus roseus]